MVLLDARRRATPLRGVEFLHEETQHHGGAPSRAAAIRDWIRLVARSRPLAPSSHGIRVEGRMTCPYLKEVAMVFCRACPVKKLVPIDHVTTASRCEGEAFKSCPLFQEALARMGQAALGEDSPTPRRPGGVT